MRGFYCLRQHGYHSLAFQTCWQVVRWQSLVEWAAPCHSAVLWQMFLLGRSLAKCAAWLTVGVLHQRDMPVTVFR
jgi:hypothetical protein